MATAVELKAFLTKRGFDVEVEKDQLTYTIKVHSKSVEDIGKLLAQIAEPGRFVVSAELQDITDLLVERSKILPRIDALSKELEDKMTRNMGMLIQTDDELRKQSTDSISGVKALLADISNKVDSIQVGLNEVTTRLVALEDRAIILDNKASLLDRVLKFTQWKS
jgi:hypothetical protein